MVFQSAAVAGNISQLCPSLCCNTSLAIFLAAAQCDVPGLNETLADGMAWGILDNAGGAAGPVMSCEYDAYDSDADDSGIQQTVFIISCCLYALLFVVAGIRAVLHVKRLGRWSVRATFHVTLFLFALCEFCYAIIRLTGNDTLTIINSMNNRYAYILHIVGQLFFFSSLAQALRIWTLALLRVPIWEDQRAIKSRIVWTTRITITVMVLLLASCVLAVVYVVRSLVS